MVQPAMLWSCLFTCSKVLYSCSGLANNDSFSILNHGRMKHLRNGPTSGLFLRCRLQVPGANIVFTFKNWLAVSTFVPYVTDVKNTELRRCIRI